LVKINNSVNEYKIEDVKRINIRYYLIKIQGKSYIIDYANPKDIRNYFFELFPVMNNMWEIYDVTESESKYEAKNLHMYQTPKLQSGIRRTYLLYILHIVNFPKNFNIHYLTINPQILIYGQLIALGILLIAIGFGVVLYFQRTNILLPNNAKFLVRKRASLDSQSLKIIIMRYLVVSLCFIGLLYLGILGSSYAQLIMFSVIPIYLLIFNKFLKVLDIKTDKYHIIEKEEN
jgi:hypothetical protein